MVIGNGLLATAFSNYKGDNSILIFASGVSNSGNTNISEFEREKSLLKSALDLKLRLVYFSTISIYDPELQDSAYILHKKEIELLIQNCSTNYLIFRLPILVGKTSNQHTLCNFIANQINASNPINIFVNACRYLIDIDDLKHVLPAFINNEFYRNLAIDVNFNNQTSMETLVTIFERQLNKKATKNFVSRGGCYKTNNTLFLSEASKYFDINDSNYIEKCISKYYKL